MNFTHNQEDYYGTEGMDSVTSSVHFTYADYTGQKFHRSEHYYEDETWPQVLNDFLNLLSGVYGYDIKNRVALVMRSTAEPNDHWGGKVVFEDDYK